MTVVQHAIASAVLSHSPRVAGAPTTHLTMVVSSSSDASALESARPPAKEKRRQRPCARTNLLRGKHKPQFAPNEDCGDYVIIVNADKVALTNGKADRKFAYRHSGYPGGLKAISYRELLATRPERAVEKAVKGMVPHTKLGRAQLKKLKVYAGAEHPHASQNPQAFEITQVAQ